MSSTKQLKAGVFLSYLTLALSNIIALTYTPFMLRMMGQSEYGLYSLVASVVAYLTILDFGFGNAIIRFTAKYRAENKHEEQYSLFGMFLILYIAIGILSFIIGLVLYNNVDTLFSGSMTVDELSKARVMILLLVINISITFPLSIFPSIVIAYENFVFNKVINIIRILLQPCLMIPLLLLGYKAIGMVVITTILNLLTLLSSCWYCFYKLKIKLYINDLDWSLMKEISGYSFYVFLAIIVDRAFWSTGQFILGILCGTTEVAIYAIVVQLCTYYMSFSLAISGVFLPKITKLITAGESISDISNMFIKIGRIQYIVLAYILVGFILFGKTFVFYWAGKGYESVYFLTLLIMIPQTVPLIQNLGISVLQAQNRQKFRSVLYIIISLFCVFISFILSKKYGVVGCAVSTGLTLFVGHGIVMNVYYQKKIQLNILQFWKQIFKLSLPISLVFILSYGVIKLIPSSSLLVVLAEICIYSIVYIVLVWFLGCNSYEKDQIKRPIMSLKLKLGF